MCRRLTIYEHLMMIGHGEVNQLCKGKVGTVLQSNCKIATEIYIYMYVWMIDSCVSGRAYKFTSFDILFSAEAHLISSNEYSWNAEGSCWLFSHHLKLL